MKDARLHEAIQHHLQGRLPEAETRYREILAEDPDNPEANHNLGDIAFRSGQVEQAVALLQKALMHDPQNPRNWRSLANTLTEAGYPDDALKVLEEGRQLGILPPDAGGAGTAMPLHPTQAAPSAAEQARAELPKQALRQMDNALALLRSGRAAQALRQLRALTGRHPGNGLLLMRYGQALAQAGRQKSAVVPLTEAADRLEDDAEALLHLASSLQQLGELRSAAEACKKGLARRPDDAPLHSMLAGVLNRLHQPREAASHASRALEIDPDHAEALNNLGNALKALKRIDKARECYVRALKLKPDYFAAYVNLGNLYRDEGDLVQAEALYESALKLRPDHAETLHNLGTICKDTRRPEQALEYYRRAARKAPDRLEHVDALSEFIRFSDPDDPLIQQMLHTLKSEQITERDKAFALFVLGKAMMDLGRQEEAFEYYRQANEASYPHAAPSPAFTSLLRTYRKLFSEAFRARTQGYGLPDVPQTLIVGYSRSGKSLIESLIEAHPRAIAEGEKRRLLDFSQEKLAGQTGQVQMDYLDALTPEQSRADAREYLNRLPADGMLRVNTLPGNNFALGALALWLPKVPIIFCRRDLMDLGIACYFKRYATGNRHAYKLEELGRHIRVYEEFMRLWLEVLPNPMLEVQYEDLVRSPETEAARIYEFLGLDWRPEYLKFLGTHEELAANIGLAHSLEAPAPIRADFVGTASPFLDQLAPLREAYESAGEFERTENPGSDQANSLIHL